VLLVDDQALIGEAVRRMVATEPDLELRFCPEAVRALDVAAEFRPTVILQDLVMPDVEGIEMVRRFRGLPATADVPIIVLSAREEPAVKAELLGGGASDYLVKLPDAVELVARIRLHSEAHARLLERNAAFAALEAANAELARERERSDALLHMILPHAIAERLKAGDGVIADEHPAVTVLFSDLCGFTEFAGRAGPRQVIAALDEIFAEFDRLAERHGVEKIKTIGDAWMAVAGLSPPRADHACAMAALALDLVAAFTATKHRLGLPLELRVGMHSGPVVAGVIGRGRFSYDLWGDTVNVASRMESHSLPGRIQLSGATQALIADTFLIEDRGTIEIKGKGAVATGFLVVPASHPGKGLTPESDAPAFRASSRDIAR
jgi:class 3 adenylate cyclase